MTASRAPAEPTVRQFEAAVERVDGHEIVLEDTYFYAESGGQPADRGTLAGIVVDDVQERDGEVVHVLAEEPTDVVTGDSVAGVIDDHFRTYCMRAHTASHVLYGAARRVCDGLGYAGFDISPEKVRVDLTAEEPLDDDDLVELERLANRAVWDSLSVRWETMSATEARAIEGIAFNDRTEEGAMAEGEGATGEGATGEGTTDEGVRVVTVEGWDVAACGGTHVENTAEIGTIETLDRSNPGKGVTRVEFAVGPTAIDRDAAVHAAALNAAKVVNSDIDGLVSSIDRLREENERLEAELQEATAARLTSRLREFETTDVDGARVAVGTVDGVDPNDLREPAETVVGDGGDAPADALVAVGPGPAPFVVVAADPEASADIEAGAVVDAVTDEFGGGGGGGPTFAQGGGLDADPEGIVDWLRERE
ncbi:alanyl-tRNA editing protein [Halorubrum vacuolatum]|uniref:Alanine--tRNA ligase n=1 Tax=Halorubrum vacuolatum TaxID=63740 RepID=A0A238WU85_HALVU|nr:DHHA1 domain-containing protein [Halorubrum vacuolatum]SNR50106.1 alanyl-tRNA synthetase [Halorubrum vacuolatum]